MTLLSALKCGIIYKSLIKNEPITIGEETMALVAFLIVCCAFSMGVPTDAIWALVVTFAVGYVVVNFFFATLKFLVYIVVGVMVLLIMYFSTMSVHVVNW